MTPQAWEKDVQCHNAFCHPNISGSVEQTDFGDFQFDTNNIRIPYLQLSLLHYVV